MLKVEKEITPVSASSPAQKQKYNLPPRMVGAGKGKANRTFANFSNL